MKTIPFYILSLMGIFLLNGCDSEALFTNDDRKYIKRLAGEWKVANLKSERIQKDGTKNLVFEMPNEGTFSANDCESVSCTYAYTGRRQITGLDGILYRNIIPTGGAVFIDETVRRVIFFYAECENVIGCDRAWTIEKNTSNEQLWVAYFTEATGSHRKLTLYLRK